MKYIYGLCGLLMCMGVQAKTQEFGEKVDGSKRVEISKILAHPEQYLENTVTVSGTIIGVCEHRGCWMELASDARFEKLRIKVRDGDMVFPVSSKGSQALAKGKLHAVNLDLSQTKRYLTMLAKRKQQDLNPDSITEALTLYQLIPSGVKILN